MRVQAQKNIFHKVRVRMGLKCDFPSFDSSQRLLVKGHAMPVQAAMHDGCRSLRRMAASNSSSTSIVFSLHSIMRIHGKEKADFCCDGGKILQRVVRSVDSWRREAAVVNHWECQAYSDRYNLCGMALVVQETKGILERVQQSFDEMPFQCHTRF